MTNPYPVDPLHVPEPVPPATDDRSGVPILAVFAAVGVVAGLLVWWWLA